MKSKLFKGFAFGLFVVLVACSTERNTFISRSYHGATAHYNGYFNANDLLNTAIKGYRTNLKEDYYQILTIAPLPNAEEVKSLYTPIDTAIAKCTKVIQRHAMPSMDKPSAKRNEYNRWIDENWLTIGIASYYRRDYDAAQKNFSYINRFFIGDKSQLLSKMWMARTFIEQKDFTEAGFALDYLDKAKEEDGGNKSEGKSGDKPAKSKYKSKLQKKAAKNKEAQKEELDFPKSLYFDIPFTRALLAEKKGSKEDEIKYLEECLQYAKRKHPRGRIHFILGQLYESQGDRANAAIHYKKCLKYNPPYEMAFNARLKNALNDGGAKTKQGLLRLLRDTKNAEFKDQIYYTLALISRQEGNEPETIGNFSKSAFYSNSNKRQQGMAYEQLGDIYFGKKDYYKAQKYYDSCSRVIPENYPNYDGVKNKATKLQSLVTAIESAQLQDSLQRIAAMSSDEQYAFAEKVIEKLKADDKVKREQEAARLLAMQEQQAATANKGSNSKGYWGNPKARQEGFEEFRKQWGQRDNVDDWRRSERVITASFTDVPVDSVAPTTTEPVNSLDSLTPEMLLANVPNTDSTLKESQETLVSALFDAGKIYNEQLNEKGLAEQQFSAIIAKPFETDFKLSAAYQIYRMYAPTDPQAIAQRDYILTNYPTSDYAGYLRDPEYFIKKREREKQTEIAYMKDLDRYERGLYYPVITSANSIITTEKDNPFLAKYYLLKAFAEAKMNDDKTTILPTLNELIALYPGTDEAKKAQEMKDIIEKGYSTNTAVDFSKKGTYTYTDKEPLTMVIFLGDNVNNAVAKTRVVDFNKEFFSRGKLNTSSKILKDKSVIIVKEFPDEFSAADYLNTYKKTRKHLLDMQNFKIFYITESNFKLLFETQKIEEYELFFDEFY